MSLRRRGVAWWMTVLFMLSFLAVPARGLDPRGPLNQYGRQVWQTDNGLPQNTVHAMVQTPDGYIWLGTDGGLVRFNGVDFKVFTTETTPALLGNAIEGLTVDGSGRLWVVTAEGLAREQNDGFRAMKAADGLPDPTVWFVHADHAGRTWVATAGGLCLMQGDRCEPVAAAKGISVSRAGRFAEAMDGSVWLGDGARTTRLSAPAQHGGTFAAVAVLKTRGEVEITAQMVDSSGRLLVGTLDGLQVEQRGALQPVAIEGLAGRVAVTALLRAADGSTWIGTSAGLAHGSGAMFRVVGSSKGTGLGTVQTLFQDREGAIWVGTTRGLARVVNGTVEHVANGDALAASSLLAGFEDREGNVWLGTESDGVTMLHEQKFTTYTMAEGLSGNVVRSVLQDAEGRVWVGTDGAGLNRRTADGFVGFSTQEGLSSNVILSMASAAGGDLWVGTPAGLNLVREGRGETRARASGRAGQRVVKVFTTADGLADDFIRSVLVDAAGSVWVGTRHGLTRLMPLNGTKYAMTTFTTLDGLGSDFIGVMVQARNGDLWIGTAGGLTRLRGGRFKNYAAAGGSAKDAITSIHEDVTGALWLGSSGGGLSRMQDEVITRLPASNLPQDSSALLEDSAKRLWIGSRSGIYRVAASDLERVTAGDPRGVAVAAYDTSDGMRIRECSSGGHPAAARMQDGRLWFATLRGVTVLDPERLHENKVPPLVAIETVLVNDSPRGFVKGRPAALLLEPGRQRVEFQYAGLSFVAPGKVQYRYRLEGFDRAWVEAGVHRAAFYTNLQPGRYVFHVAAMNNDGVWSETEATVALRVKPFFWQTLWFYAALLLLAAVLAYLIYAWRVRRVEALYQGVMEERSRIAREIHDTLAQGIVSISLQLEVATRLLGTSTEAARKQLDETRALVRQSLAEARSSIWDLRSEGAEELPVRMGRSLKTLTASSGLKSRLQVTGSYRALGQMIEEELLRVAQEAITNAVRHAACTRVDVMLAYEMKSIRLLVSDDGQGFDMEGGRPAGHFGLQGMQERAGKINARLEVKSEAGQGTQVSLERPLP